MTGGVFDDITSKLEHNGGLTEREYRNFVVLALRDIYRGVEKINKIEARVEALEENNLILIAKKYPKLTVSLLIFFSALTTATVIHIGLGEWVLRLLGIPVP